MSDASLREPRELTASTDRNPVQWRLGIAVSNSPDLERLGLLETHFRVAIGEITRSVLLAGGGLIYGGTLDPNGYTTFVMRELQRYTRRDRPLLACLSWDQHTSMEPAALESFRHDLGLFGRLVLLSPDGEPLAWDAKTGTPQGDTAPGGAFRARCLTGLRRFMVEQQVGRVFFGGRREQFLGRYSGVVEEVLLTLEAGQPTYLAGGYGGATYDITRLVGLHDQRWPIATETPSDPRHTAGLEALRDLLASERYTGLNNGLTESENQWLARSHRPGEIASLVSRGLKRVLRERWSPGAQEPPPRAAEDGDP